MCFSRTTRSLSKYNVKIELDCSDCMKGFFSDYSLQCLQNKTIKIHVLQKKSTRLWGIFISYKGKLNVPRVHTEILIES